VAVSEEEPPSLPTPHVQSKEMVCIRVLAYGCDDKGRPLLQGRRRPNPGNVLHCLRFLLADALRALPFGALWPTVSGSCAVFFEMPARHERLLRQWNVAQRKSRMLCGCCSHVGLWLILVTRDSRLKEINFPSWPRTYTYTYTQQMMTVDGGESWLKEKALRAHPLNAPDSLLRCHWRKDSGWFECGNSFPPGMVAHVPRRIERVSIQWRRLGHLLLEEWLSRVEWEVAQQRYRNLFGPD